MEDLTEREVEGLVMAFECARDGLYSLFTSDLVDWKRRGKLATKSRYSEFRAEQLAKKMIMHNLNLAPCCVKGLCKFGQRERS